MLCGLSSGTRNSVTKEILKHPEEIFEKGAGKLMVHFR
jgi:hypothetical protein